MSLFKGTATALITPFKDGKIDYVAMGKLVEWQIGQGIDALVVCGTTGEASTLSAVEKRPACPICHRPDRREGPCPGRHRFQQHQADHGAFKGNGRRRGRRAPDSNALL